MAPPPPSPSLDYWRGFFSGARASIFDTIDAAIRLAAADNPDGLRARRDAIAHRLYTVLNVLPPPEDAVVVAAAPAFPDGTRRHDPIVAEVFRVKAALASNRQMVPTFPPLPPRLTSISIGLTNYLLRVLNAYALLASSFRAVGGGTARPAPEAAAVEIHGGRH